MGNIHPLIVHFPIMLLLLYPIFMIRSAIDSKNRSIASKIGGCILVVGVITTSIAIESGEALGTRVKTIAPVVYQVYERHELFAERTQRVGILTLIIHTLSLLSPLIKQPLLTNIVTTAGYRRTIAILGIVLATLVGFTGSEGGKLTHQYKVGAYHCQMMAHPLGTITESIAPLDDKLAKREETYASKQKSGYKALFETLCQQ